MSNTITLSLSLDATKYSTSTSFPLTSINMNSFDKNHEYPPSTKRPKRTTMLSETPEGSVTKMMVNKQDIVVD